MESYNICPFRYGLGLCVVHLSMSCRRWGEALGRAWGGDLIVFFGPGVGHLTDLVLPGRGDI